MATTNQIQLYTAAGSTDPVNDYFLGYNASATAYRKYNRNTLLGITGSPVGTTDNQTLSGKTLTSPTINGATLSGTISGTYTLGGTPTFPSSVVTLTGSQTLTNKTLTSPSISGGSISNATIAVDSISGFSTSTIVTIGGVQMNNGVISTSGAVVSNSIAAGAVTPNTLASGAGTGWSWQSWTPTLTNVTLGNGTLISNYIQIGKMVHVRFLLQFGTTTSMTGAPTMNLPVAARSTYITIGNFLLGYGICNTSAGQIPSAPFFNGSNTVVTFGYWGGSNLLTAVTPSAPATWTTNNLYNFSITYEAA